jgi:hypothetical protein
VIAAGPGDSFSIERLERLWRWATVYAKSGVVPPHFSKPEAAFVAVELADRSGLPVMLLMQEVYLIHGRPAMSGKLAIALLRRSGAVSSGPTYEFVSDDKGKVVGCTCRVVDAKDGYERAETLDIATIEAEGWLKPKGDQKSKWITDPQQMFCYRSAMRLIRRCYPDVILGLYTPEEIQEMDSRVVDGQVHENPQTLSHKQPSVQARRGKASSAVANRIAAIPDVVISPAAGTDQVDEGDQDMSPEAVIQRSIDEAPEFNQEEIPF